MSTLLMLHSAVHDVHTAVQHVFPLADPPPAVPTIGNGTPPGADKVSLLLGWGKYIFYAIAFAGVIMVGAQMVISKNRHSGSDHGSSLGWLGAGCILVGAAVPIVTSLVG